MPRTKAIPGEPVVFVDDFPREGGRARFVPADIIPADERPDADYPMVLITGRQLEHWHTGSMTRRADVLDAIEPDPVALMHPLDLEALGVQPGDVVTIESRRGEVSLYARADDSSPRGAVFVPFCYYEAAINKLTNAGARPVRQDPRVQVLRGARQARRRRRRRAASAAARCWRPARVVKPELSGAGRQTGSGPTQMHNLSDMLQIK